MEFFSNQMCRCADKSCADQVSQDMATWGATIARRASDRTSHPDPDPDLAKRSADAMTRYTECVTRLSTATAGGAAR